MELKICTTVSFARVLCTIGESEVLSRKAEGTMSKSHMSKSPCALVDRKCKSHPPPRLCRNYIITTPDTTPSRIMYKSYH